MQQCSCRLFISKTSHIPLTGITPAELVMLVKEHENRAGRHPVTDLVISETPAQIEFIDYNDDKETTQSRELTKKEEVERLRARYGFDAKKNRKFDVCFPGEFPNIPETFEETGLLEQSQKAS